MLTFDGKVSCIKCDGKGRCAPDSRCRHLKSWEFRCEFDIPVEKSTSHVFYLKLDCFFRLCIHRAEIDMGMADLGFWLPDVGIEFLHQHFQADVLIVPVTRRDFLRDLANCGCSVYSNQSAMNPVYSSVFACSQFRSIRCASCLGVAASFCFSTSIFD